MKNKEKKPLHKRKGFFVITTILLSCTLGSLFLMGMTSGTNSQSLGTSGSSTVNTTADILIEKPTGWKTKETAISVKVTGTADIKKVEAKIGSTGNFVDITDDMKINLSENATLYVQVTDKNSATYSKSRYIEIFDREIPTVKATTTKTLLHIEANDNISGVYGVYVDGTLYTNLVNDTLDIKLSEIGKTYEEITVQAVDNAGNKSKVLTVKNPNYKEDTSSKTSTSSATSSETATGTASTTSTQNGTASTTSTQNGTAGTSSFPNGNATGTNTTAPTSASNVSSSSASGSSSSSTGESTNHSNAPLFGTYKDTNKQFMSIATVDGTVYYLIIDHDKEDENVYFLSPVTNEDLEHLAQEASSEEDANSYPEYLGENSESETQFVESKPETEDTSSDTMSEADTTKNDETTPKKKRGGSAILIIIAVLAITGAGFYFKIYKPKMGVENADDLDDFQFAEDEEDLIFDKEDEPVYFDDEEKEE